MALQIQFDNWVPYIVGERTKIVASLDWTEFDADDHSTLVLSLQTSHIKLSFIATPIHGINHLFPTPTFRCSWACINALITSTMLWIASAQGFASCASHLTGVIV